nr:phospholipase D-like domain-containing protein [uncultured Flavobacterium sp.]
MVLEKMNEIQQQNLPGENLTLVHSGRDFFDRLERLISEAKSEIHFQVYIFDGDATGTRIANALMQAATRNVKVYLLLDSFGSNSLPDEFIKKLETSGIQLRFFSPFFSFNTFYLGRRLHHKVVVVDAEKVLIGGINIAEKYEGTTKEPAWLDYAILIDDAKIGVEAQSICHAFFFKTNPGYVPKYRSVQKPLNASPVTVLQNDWLKGKKEIQRAYIRMINAAKSEIIIVGSYFLPGRKLKKALKKAARRNVTVQLILSGTGDVPLVKDAIDYSYSSFLKNNIALYEWNDSILHGKAAIVDGKWATIGSFNLNHLSSYASIEMNIGSHSEPFTEYFRDHLKEVISKCTQITPESFQSRNTVKARLKRFFSYVIVRFFEILITYLPHIRFLKLF